MKLNERMNKQTNEWTIITYLFSVVDKPDSKEEVATQAPPTGQYSHVPIYSKSATCIVPFPNINTFDWLKIKAFAADTFFLAPILKFVFLSKKKKGSRKKGENAGYQYFLFPQCFQKEFSSWSFKTGIVWWRVNFEADDKSIWAIWKKKTGGAKRTCVMYGTKQDVI